MVHSAEEQVGGRPLVAAFRRLLNDVNNNRPTTLQTDKGSEFLKPTAATVAERVRRASLRDAQRGDEGERRRALQQEPEDAYVALFHEETDDPLRRRATGFRAFVQRQLSSQHRHGSFGGERRQSGNGVAAVVRARRWWYAPSIESAIACASARRNVTSRKVTWRTGRKNCLRSSTRIVRIRPFIDWSTGTAIAWTAPSTNQKLQKVIVSADKTYRVEAELRRRNNGREVLVKWFGLPRVVQQLDRREDVDVVYMNGDTPCCFFLLQSTRSVSGHNHDRCRVWSVRLSDSVAKKPISA